MTATQEVRETHAYVHLMPTQQTKETRANWLRWITDPQIRQWMCGVLPEHPEEVYRWVTNATTDPLRHYFDIVSDNKTVGFVSLRQDQLPTTTGEIGIVIGDKQYQSRGIGTQAISDILVYAKNIVQLHSVRALIKPDNEKSIKLFTGAGFSLTDYVTINDTRLLKFEKKLV